MGQARPPSAHKGGGLPAAQPRNESQDKAQAERFAQYATRKNIEIKSKTLGFSQTASQVSNGQNPNSKT